MELDALGLRYPAPLADQKEHRHKGDKRYVHAPVTATEVTTGEPSEHSQYSLSNCGLGSRLFRKIFRIVIEKAK